ncbi:hypothetical protein DFQ28_002446 [Apophysomyces sp. BC1034]|nr:hypothetical protein DFQ30_004156 [Apophysomyces sp. BC1015]KAG0178582.1 hypothetical protein DFQ29_003265 [Apophysomyces sp. BC1021]KAG0190134.1 hypothetical protein DFQ28_002446 [Apophysomyces sp. BC1034]
MTPLPPKLRTFVQPAVLPKHQSVPGPEGISLIVSHFYIKAALFYEDTLNAPDFMNAERLQNALSHTLTHYYAVAGRLSPVGQGRYIITDFHKGVLFQVVQSTDDYEMYKNKRYSYSAVPFHELFALRHYTSRDLPLMGVQLTQLRGGVVLGFSLHHKIFDGVVAHNFVKVFSQIALGKEPTSHTTPYHDWERNKNLPSSMCFDHSIDYPVIDPEYHPKHNWDAPSQKRLVVISKEKLAKLRSFVQQTDPSKKLSTNDVLAAFLFKLIVKARNDKMNRPCDLVYVASKRHLHHDKRMIDYFGNYYVAALCRDRPSDLANRTLFETAERLRHELNKITIPYMESLENYINSNPDPTRIVSPLPRTTPLAVGWSDWSHFTFPCDFGYGGYKVVRPYVEPTPYVLVITMPSFSDELEILLQLDTASMQRLLSDTELRHIASAVF